MAKRLLVLGAGRGQIGLYKAAREMGIITIAGTMPDNNPPCTALADEVCYMNIANPEDVAVKAASLHLDGVATCCLDTGIAALGRACDELDLVGLSANAAVMCNDKSKMKKALVECGVSTAKYYEVRNVEELNVAMKSIRLPVIVKATDLQGSRGVYIARSEQEAIAGFEEAMELTKRDYCIVEEFIEGWEFGAQAFVYQGEVLFVMPHGDNTYMSHTAVPVGHYVPLDVSDNIIDQTVDTVKGAIRALGLDNCAVNVDLILKDDTVYLIELTGRVGANCLPELVEINYGIEYYKMIAAMAVGDDPLVYWKNRNAQPTAGLAKMIISTDRGGTIQRLEYEDNHDPDVVEVTFFKHTGDHIRKFTDSNDCIGQLIVKGRDMAACEKKEQEVLSRVAVELV